MPQQDNVDEIISHLFRQESGKMVAVLSRLFGLSQVDEAQDLVQDTLLAAMKVWPYKGVPANPSAWLMQVAKNKAIDYLRKQHNHQDKMLEYGYLLNSEYSLSQTVAHVFSENEIEDNQLRMMFACCHPSLAEEGSIALVLKLLCGFGLNEIAAAFVSNTETIAKRIYRAKEKIRNEGIELLMPHGQALEMRLQTVLKVLYLMFSEGYYSAHPDHSIREDVCEEAMRLCHLLITFENTNTAETKALMALMCFQVARFVARNHEPGQQILLEQQDRSLWHRGLIQKGYYFLEQASEQAFDAHAHASYSAYHLEAAIAALHCNAASFEQTNWPKIATLYEILYKLKPGKIVAMNRAVALAYAGSTNEALALLQQVKGMEQSPIFHCVIGQVFLLKGAQGKAQSSFRQALSLAQNPAERQLIQSKLSQI